MIQEKTGAEVWVPLHPDLQTELAGTERRGETIIAAELLRSDGLRAKLLWKNTGSQSGNALV